MSSRKNLYVSNLEGIILELSGKICSKYMDVSDATRSNNKSKISIDLLRYTT